LAALVALGTLFAFSNAAPSVFVHDDKLVIPPNMDRGINAVPQLFREPTWAAAATSVATYRPLLTTSFVVEGQLWQDRPRGMHRINVALHILVTLVLFGFLEALRTRARAGRLPDAPPPPWSALPSAFAALAFGVHPIHTEIVDSVFNRSEILSTLGVLSALWMLVRWFDRRPALAWAGAGGCYLSACCRARARRCSRSSQ
jgi:hypothetical protein